MQKSEGEEKELYFFQRKKYFSTIILFHNQVTGKNVDVLMENMIAKYHELDHSLLEEIIASYFLTNWIQKKWPPMRSRPLVQSQGKLVLPSLINKFKTFESTMSHLFFEFFHVTSYFKHCAKIVQKNLVQGITELPIEICDYISTFLYPKEFTSKLNLWQSDEKKTGCKKYHPIYFSKIDNGSKRMNDGLTIKNNIYYQLHDIIVHRNNQNGCNNLLSTIVSVLQNLNATGIMLDFTVDTFLPTLMYNYRNCDNQNIPTSSTVSSTDDYKRIVVYHIGILFKSLQDEHHFCMENFENLSSSFKKQFEYVKLDFHDLIRNNIGTLKLHGKEQFVIDEFQQKIVGGVVDL